MQVNFIPTLGGNLYYLGDADDEDASLLRLEFISEFASLPKEVKRKVAHKILKIAIHDIIEEMSPKIKHDFTEEGF